ncbi:hypothetical protein Pcinc_029780 [Petrolisthes cinctipes]|uniref:Uncharacterized protein n=1 Tax=Petrolisthes cinctipes TaxID=88211 RepID=A0AAE1F047_PETCI|nr:hypothetical protein Pcinc_029780 [Petrolisthes cinctipes]
MLNEIALVQSQWSEHWGDPREGDGGYSTWERLTFSFFYLLLVPFRRLRLRQLPLAQSPPPPCLFLPLLTPPSQRAPPPTPPLHIPPSSPGRRPHAVAPMPSPYALPYVPHAPPPRPRHIS